MDAIGVPAARAVRGAVRPGSRPRDGIIHPGVSRRGVPVLTPDFEEQLDASRRARRALRVLMMGECVTRSQINGHATGTGSAPTSHQKAENRSYQALTRMCDELRHNLSCTSQDRREPRRSSSHPHVWRIETQPELHVGRRHPP